MTHEESVRAMQTLESTEPGSYGALVKCPFKDWGHGVLKKFVPGYREGDFVLVRELSYVHKGAILSAELSERLEMGMPVVGKNGRFRGKWRLIAVIDVPKNIVEIL